MGRFISEKNLRVLLVRMAKEGKRVIAPSLHEGTLLYRPVSDAVDINLSDLPRRSAKEAFFPVCEDILSFEREGTTLRLADVDPAAFPETVLIGVRPCDAAAGPVLDAVFSWDHEDMFYLERRRKTTIIGLACTTSDDACFCTSVGLKPSDTRGSDMFLTPVDGGGFTCESISEKGEVILSRYGDLFETGRQSGALLLSKPRLEAIDLKKVKEWLDSHFDDPFWDTLAQQCVGCGACAFVCPVCHCFDIVDEGTEQKGRRRKSWDACGFSKFTHHASGHNPRNAQPKRYRNRIMHKFKYYGDKFDQTLCTGCGRCIRICPVGIDIAAIVEDVGRKKA